MTTTYVFGLQLRFTTTAEGGRTSGLQGGSSDSVRYEYRPNWGLPAMRGTDQTGAPVLAFSRSNIEPGDVVRLVIVPPFPEMLDQWANVEPGADLRMFEGSRICGVGRVLWRREAELPLAPHDEDRYRAWVAGPEGAPDPD